MTLPSAAARAPAVSTDICCPRPGCGKRQMSIDGTDRQTDGQLDGRTSDHGRYIDHAQRAVMIWSWKRNGGHGRKQWQAWVTVYDKRRV